MARGKPPAIARQAVLGWYVARLPSKDMPLFPRIWIHTDTFLFTEVIEKNLSALSIDAQKRAEKDSQKKAAKAASAEAKAQEQRATSKVIIKRIERNKRKYVTAVQGLESFGLDIKKVAKDFGKKFATGSSVTKIPGGGEEITVQGDLSDDIFDYLTEKYEEIPEDNVECIEDKKKKAAS